MAEATARLAFLADELGFAGPEVTDQDDYPLMICVSYHRADLRVEASLVLSYGGEEYVTLAAMYPRGSARRIELGEDAAHTGFQLQRALDRQTRALREFLARPGPGEHR